MSALATMPTVAAEDGIEAEHHNNVAANIRTISRNFWDAGTPDLPLSEQKQGTSWMDPTTLAMWIFRIAGEDDPRDAGSPLRPTWHWNDFEGPPPADGRVAEGDCLIWDSGSGDTYVLYRDAGRFRGLGVLVEYRTAATATNGTTQNQSSDRITMRSSRWDTSGTPAAQDREWSMYCHTSASAGDGYSLLHIDRRHNGGSWTGVATLDTNGWLYLAGGVPGVELNSGGAGSAFLRLYSLDPDGSLLKFGHGNGSRWGRFRAYGTTTGGTGLAADVLGVSYGSAATGGATLKNSPSFAHYASAWDGVSAAVELGSYEQLIPTSSTAAYLRRGFGFGDATWDLYGDGNAWLRGDVDTNLWLTQHTDADSGDKDRDSLALVLRATSWDGAAAAERGFAQIATITSPADASDTYELRWIDINTSAVVMQLDSAGNLGVGGSPATRFHSAETKTITGAVTDGYAAGFTLAPTYTAATAQTVTRHNYLDVKNVTLAGAGPAALTDACFARFDAAAGTHKAVASGTTKTTPGGVDAWVKVNINGTIHYMPAYLSKTA